MYFPVNFFLRETDKFTRYIILALAGRKTINRFSHGGG